MNYHSDEFIMERVREHYNDALEHFPRDKIVCMALAGSQNYGLDMEGSDVDTKLVVAPSFNDIAMNKQPVSTTHVRPNNEHIGFHDIRLYIPTFRKGNINFVETLFSKYTVVNPLYAYEWNRLVEAREEIARYDKVQAIKSIRGQAYNKYKYLENNSPARAKDIEKFGYSPKEYCHLLRFEEFLTRYIDGEYYADCLITKQPEHLKNVKRGCYTLGDVRWMAMASIARIDKMCEKYLESCDKTVNESVDELLDDVQYNIMKIAIEKEIGGLK